MQQPLFNMPDADSDEQSKTPVIVENSQWGTFRDSLRAPIHSWFTYPAGFSYKAVEHSLDRENLTPGKSLIYDPFMGSGTTNIVAKHKGFHSVGVEAHPFVYDITLTKITWDIDFKAVTTFLEKVESLTSDLPSEEVMKKSNAKNFPELVQKCFLPEALYALWMIRESISQGKALSIIEKRFLQTALICTLRDVSIAATGWPYIAPKKIKITSMSKNAPAVYIKRAHKMLEDVRVTKLTASDLKTKHEILLGDSRKTEIKTNSVDHIFTSPPYLNNFDYADRTRLEMYFMGAASNWGDISSKIRTKLMTSATTQISRNDSRYILSEKMKKVAPEVYGFLSRSQEELSALRKVKGGKKSYDLLITGYFNDMFEILQDNYRVMKKGGKAVYILGDSAPYGVHIPTDELIGQLAVAIGFSKFDIEILRVRGGKWAANPQRHSVALRETIVTVVK